MPLPPFPIPDDVREWVRSVFSSCNARVTGKLDRLPTTHETSLDLSLIEALSQISAPVRTPSGHLVRIDVHFLGGGRHFGTWEVADIGALLIYRSGTEVVRTKVALLQSKRLYPVEQAFEEDSPLTYATGFGRLNTSDEEFLRVTTQRKFSFLRRGLYAATAIGDPQWRAIEGYEQRYAIPVYYNLYHPSAVPSHAYLPANSAAARAHSTVGIGCRVIPATRLRSALAHKAVGSVPSFSDLHKSPRCRLGLDAAGPGWRLENFFADELLQCSTGYIAGSATDPGLTAVFTQRGAPIAAAIAITVAAPEG